MNERRGGARYKFPGPEEVKTVFVALAVAVKTLIARILAYRFAVIL